MHCNFLIILPIPQETCSRMVFFFFARQNMCALGDFAHQNAPDRHRARNFSRPEFVFIVKGCLSSSHKLSILLRSESERRIFPDTLYYFGLCVKFGKHFYQEQIFQTKAFFGNINFTNLTNLGSFSQALHYHLLATIYSNKSRFKKRATIIIVEVDANGNLESSTSKRE